MLEIGTEWRRLCQHGSWDAGGEMVRETENLEARGGVPGRTGSPRSARAGNGGADFQFLKNLFFFRKRSLVVSAENGENRHQVRIRCSDNKGRFQLADLQITNENFSKWHVTNFPFI